MKPVPFYDNADLHAMTLKELQRWMERADQLNKHEAVNRALLEIEARYAADGESYFAGEEPEEFRVRVLRMVAACKVHHPLGVGRLRTGLRYRKAVSCIEEMVRNVTGGFHAMVERGQTDDTAEAIALAFPAMFDQDVRDIARARLVEFDPAWARECDQRRPPPP